MLLEKMKRITKNELYNEFSIYSKILRLYPSRVEIKHNLKNKNNEKHYGLCRRINKIYYEIYFDTELLKATIENRRNLIVHELTHLKYFDLGHSIKFWLKFQKHLKLIKNYIEKENNESL